MTAAISSCWPLFLGMALLMIGNGLQGSLLGVRAAIEHFPTTLTGVLMSAYYLGFLVGSLLTPKLVMRVGHVRVFAALASLASTAILIHAVFVEPTTWVAVRLASGFCYAGLYVVAESWLNEQATNETRGQLLSIYLVISYGGMALGQGLLNTASPGGSTLFMLVSILVSLSLIPMLLSATKGPAFAASSPISVKELYQASPTGMVGFFVAGLAQGGAVGMGAVYTGMIGLSVPLISLFMTMLLLGGMLLQWPLGLLSDRFDRRLVLTVVTFVAAALALAGAMGAADSIKGLLIIIFLFGGMMLPMYSLCLAYTNDYLKPEQMVAASGTLVLVGGCGAALGPTMIALTMEFVGPPGYFWWLFLVHCAIGVFILYRMTQRPAMPLEAQGSSYASIPLRATPVAAAMYGEEAAVIETAGADAASGGDEDRATLTPG
jgi:MFS family permease